MKTLLTSCLLLFCCSAIAASNDFEGRTALTLQKKINDSFTAKIYYRNDMDNEFHDTSKHNLKLKGIYNAHKNLSFALATTYQKQREEEDWSDRFRLELEMTPRYEWQYLKASFRNRFEARHTESGDHHDIRTRHKLILICPIKEDRPFLKSIYSSAEAFINLDNDQNRMDEHRLEPLGMVFNLSESLSIKFYALLIYKRDHDEDRWSEQKVAGTALTYRL